MNEISFYRKPQYVKDLSHKFKKEQTDAEMILWKELRDKKLGWYKFYRQKSIFVYREENWKDRFFIADFYNHQKKLIIEIDGSVHLEESVKEYDKMREYLLKELWYTIIRFTNSEVLNDIKHVLTKILKKLDGL